MTPWIGLEDRLDKYLLESRERSAQSQTRSGESQLGGNAELLSDSYRGAKIAAGWIADNQERVNVFSRVKSMDNTERRPEAIARRVVLQSHRAMRRGISEGDYRAA